MRIELGRPWFLLILLAIPLLALWFRRARGGRLGWPDRSALILRGLLIAAVALALAEPRWVSTVKGRATAFVGDVSESIPTDSRAEASDRILRWLRDRDPLHEDVSYLVFADGSGIETPFQGLGGLRPEDIRPLDPARVGSLLDRGQSDVAAALRTAGASFPPEAARRVILVTDGNETRGDAAAAVRDLVASGVEVLVYPLRFRRLHEVLVDKVVAPPRARSGQPVPVRVVVESTEDDVEAELRFTDERDQVLSTEKVTLRKGRNAWEVKRQFDTQGLHTVRCTVTATGDGDLANNRGTAAIFVEGNPAILVAAKRREEAEPIRRALGDADVYVELTDLSALPQSPGALMGYDVVVLVNAHASDLSTAQARMLQSAVEETGLGLLAVGGPESFTAGAWGGTPLEEVLPVSMDVSQKRVLPNGACVVVLHTCEFPQGNDWARTITKQVIRSLGRNDWFGCVDYEGGASSHWAVPLARGNQQAMLAAVEKANPCDMFSLHDCVSVGVDALEKCNAYLKHMVVISDGDPAMPDDKLVQRMIDMGITISAVAIAQHGMLDAMKPMTERTGGRYYALDEGKVDSLPAIFMKEASVVRRSSVFEEPFIPQVASAHAVLKGIPADGIPPLGGYIVTSLKDRAEAILVEPKNGDPVLATWRKGLGVATAFTSDLAGRWAKEWLAWDRYDKFVSQLVRSCSRGIQRSTFGMSVEASGGFGRAVVEAVDAQGNYVDGLSFQGSVLSPSGKSEPLVVLQKAQGRYEAEFRATEPGLYLVSLLHDLPGSTAADPKRAQVRAACPVDYSPEHLALSSSDAFFDRVASAGAKVIGREDRPFLAALPETRTLADAWRWVLLAAILLFPLEVAARRLRLDPGPLVAQVREKIAALRGRLPAPKPRPATSVVATDVLATAGKAGIAAEEAAKVAGATPASPAAAAGDAAKGEAPGPAVPPTSSDELLKAKRKAKKQSTWEDNA